MIGAAVRTHLLANAGVTAYTRRIYPAELAEGKQAPAIVYDVPDDNRDALLSGAGTYRDALIDFECWSDKYEDAHLLANAVESAMTDYTGTLGTSSPAIDADHIRMERRFDIRDRDAELYGVAMQFFIGYEAS
jgi:hypothetical protein